MSTDNKLVGISIMFLGFGLLFLALREFSSFLRPFVIALLLTFLLVPLTRLSGKRKRNIWFATLAVVVGLFLTLPVFFSLISGGSPEDTTPLADEQEVGRALDSFLPEGNLIFFGIEIDLNSLIDIEKVGAFAGQITGAFLSSFGTFLTEFFLVLLFLIFLLPSHDATVSKIANSLDEKSKKKFLAALVDIEKNIRAYLYIKSAISLATAILSGLVMFLFGVKGVFLFAFLIFALNFIPSIGSFIAVAIVLLSHFLSVGLSLNFVIVGVLLILVQVIMGNILDPKFSGKELELSPVIILLSLFFWGSVWGIGGMFLAVPLTSIMKIVLSNIDSTQNFVKYLA